MEIKNKEKLNKYIYYENDNGILLCGDNAGIMPLLEANSIDLIVTDPPYNIGDENKLCKQGDKILSNKEMWGHFEPKDEKEWLIYLEKTIKEFYRINKGSVYLFYDKFNIGKIKEFCEMAGYYPKNLLAIIKVNPLPHFRKNGFRSDFELCLFCQKEKDKDVFNFLSQDEMKSVDYYTIGQKDSDHPTEKPVSVICKYIKISSNEGAIILDPFIGSGTTAIACEKLNRRWVGIEISEEYCEIAKKRIEAEHNQLKMF